MSMNDLDNKRKYTKYTRHVNDSSERINAKTINTLQKDVQEGQIERIDIKDEAFHERVYTIFDNNLYVNAMFLDTYQNGNYINMNLSDNVIRDAIKSNVILKNKTISGKIQSIKIQSVYGDEIELNDFFLVTNQYVPVGAQIKYYLKLHTGNRFEITPNVLKTPFHLVDNVKYGLFLEAELIPNALGESPVINDYALMYWDAQIEANLGLINPDLQRFP